MGKLVALDIGEKRIGMATSEDNNFAFPFKTVMPENIEKELNDLSHDEITGIVVGLPRNMDGSIGFQAERVKSFVNDHLEKYIDLIEYIDETATSIKAREIMKNEGKDPVKKPDLIDAYAAKIILEDYIRERKNGSS